MVPTQQKWEASQLIVMHAKDFLHKDTPLQVQGKIFVSAFIG